MSQNRFWNLLAKRLSGDALHSELVELEQLIKENPEWVFAAEHIERLWKLKAREQDSYDAEVAFAQHLQLQKKNGLDLSHLDVPAGMAEFTYSPILRKTNKLRSISIAVVVLISVAGFVWNLNNRTSGVPVMKKSVSEVSTGLGNKSKLVLPDSTIVWLNAGSKLTYNEQFGISNRQTTLIGEAYFEVKKSTVPFVIHANSVEIRVLGTVFNVKSYPNEKTTETTLIQGRIEISLEKRPGEKFILKPNEKLIVANDTEEIKSGADTRKKEPMVVLGSLTHTEDQTIIETSWVDNKLIFQDESLEEMAKKMERWYNVTIDITDQKIAQMRGTATLENETVKQALDALQIAFRFNYTIHQNKITITQ